MRKRRNRKRRSLRETSRRKGRRRLKEDMYSDNDVQNVYESIFSIQEPFQQDVFRLIDRLDRDHGERFFDALLEVVAREVGRSNISYEELVILFPEGQRARTVIKEAFERAGKTKAEIG